jgi:hypothetical protein
VPLINHPIALVGDWLGEMLVTGHDAAIMIDNDRGQDLPLFLATSRRLYATRHNTVATGVIGAPLGWDTMSPAVIAALTVEVKCIWLRN